MAYHFKDTQLRVFRKYAREERNKDLLAKMRFIILEHILPTTENMVNILRENGAEIHAIVAKPYSIVTGVMERLQNNEFNIISETYEKYESTDILKNVLSEAVAKSEKIKRI